MAQKFLNDPQLVGVGFPVIATASTTFSVADPLVISAAGTLEVAGAGEDIIGFSLEDVTTITTNVTGATLPQTVNPAVAGYAPKYVPASFPGLRMQYTADQACTQGDIGNFADFKGTTGAIQIDLVAGTTGTMLVVGFDPDHDGSTTEVVVEPAETLWTPSGGTLPN